MDNQPNFCPSQETNICLPFIEIISESAEEQRTKHVTFVEGTAEAKELEPLAVLDSNKDLSIHNDFVEELAVSDGLPINIWH